MSANPLSTGELRAALQRIVFIRLITDAGPGFPAATVVAAQFWGQGKVVLTRFPDGAIMTAIAHHVRGELIESNLDTPAAFEERDSLEERDGSQTPTPGRSTDGP
jgi:hypothetical protein